MRACAGGHGAWIVCGALLVSVVGWCGVASGNTGIKYPLSPAPALETFPAPAEAVNDGLSRMSKNGVYAADQSVDRVKPSTISIPAKIEGETASAITPTEAVLSAQVIAEGPATTCNFQYVELATFILTEYAAATQIPCPGTLEGFTAQTVSVNVSALEPGTTYHYRVLATNASAEETPGLDETFTTPEVPITTTAESHGPGAVLLKGELNPHGASGQVTYQFDYNNIGTCTGGASTPPIEVAEGKEVQVQAEAQGLEPNKRYTFCLMVTNASGGQALSDEVSTYTATQPPTISGVGFSAAAAEGVTLSIQVNPENARTNYFFEYGLTPAYGSQTAPRGAGEGGSPAIFTARVSGLQPETTYYFRAVALNIVGEAARGAEELTFTTLPTGITGLPDQRVYEMVTPQNNHEAEVYVPLLDGAESAEEGTSEGAEVTQLFQVAADGDSVTYAAAPSIGGDGATSGGNGGGNEYVATRSPEGGWNQTNISPPSVDHNTKPVYQGFSKNLSAGILPYPPATEENARLSSNAPGEAYRVLYEANTEREGLYQPLFTTVPPNRSAEEFGSDEVDALGHKNAGTWPVFAGGSANFSQLLFEANDALITGEGSIEKELNEKAKKEKEEGRNSDYLYDSTAGHLGLVDVLPNGKVEPNATFGAPALERPKKNLPNFSNVISEDGRRVFWTDLSSEIIYVRESLDGTEGKTIQVSEGPARFWTATPDGRYAFYVENGALYSFDVESESREELAGASVSVQSVIGTSADGSFVYFVGCGAGGCALYVRHENVARRIVEEFGVQPAGLGDRTAEVTPDGRNLVFESSGSPTGYSSDGMTEVYVYNFESNRVFCVSCDSSGELPPVAANRELAAFLPQSWGSTYIPPWISDDGSRVFFDSAEPLVSQDTNGRQDVYEWEREGAGSCSIGSGADGGCIYLLSGGISSHNSWLGGESPNGEDVFIITRAQLTPQDGNENYDLYDARISGVPYAALPACTGAGCQGTPAPAPVFATPPSVTFDGTGNFSNSETSVAKIKPKPKSTKCKKGDAKKKGRCAKHGNKKVVKKASNGRKVTR